MNDTCVIYLGCILRLSGSSAEEPASVPSFLIVIYMQASLIAAIAFIVDLRARERSITQHYMSAAQHCALYICVHKTRDTLSLVFGDVSITYSGRGGYIYIYLPGRCVYLQGQ